MNLARFFQVLQPPTLKLISYVCNPVGERFEKIPFRIEEATVLSCYDFAPFDHLTYFTKVNPNPINQNSLKIKVRACYARIT